MRVSVVMATRNPELNALKEAVDSVYGQTFKDIELIIVDDGSDIPVCDVIKPLINESIPARVFRIVPSGLGAALNHGIKQAEGEFIARIDDDDIMLPSRLERQVEFLDENPDVSCVGTWFYDKVGEKCLPHRAYPLEHKNLVKDLLSMHWGLAHTTVMYRKASFDKIGGYRISGGGQDLDLFLQLGTMGKLANIGEFLCCYTMSSSGLGSVNPRKKDAYIFALNDVVERNLYPDYIEQAKASIRLLKKQKRSALRTRVIRTIMVWRIKLLGKKIEIS